MKRKMMSLLLALAVISGSSVYAKVIDVMSPNGAIKVSVDIIFLFITCVLLLYVLCLHLLHEDIDASNVLIIFVSSKSYSIYFYAELS